MSKNIQAAELGAAIEQELTLYARDVQKDVDAAGKRAMNKLVRRTRATAPVGNRGSYRRNITSKKLASGHGTTKFVWYVKAPDHRLTHLLVHGHATKDGGRTRSDPFLKNALDQVLPEYEREIKEAIEK